LLNTATIVPAEKNEAGLVTIDRVSDEQTGPFAAQLKQTVTFDRIFNALMTAPQLGDFKIVAEGFTPKRSLVTFTPPGSTDSDDAREFREAAKAHQSYLMQIAIVPFLNAPSSTLGDMTKTKSAVLLSLNPEMTIKTRVQESLGITGGAETGGDPLEPILDAPDFPQPMYETLRDLSEDFLFFGLEHVPLNTVMLLKTNPKFVESFLVGLNAEMSHELLWRNYPTDQRGTYFRQFWDGDQPDIEVIKKWDDRKLGDNARAGEELVLGMDVANFEKPPPPLTAPEATWNDLSWRRLVKTEEELKALSHASIRTVLLVIRRVEWGMNSAHQAYITLQRPVRIAIHAKEMISKV
jgi:hypothetical protein